MLSVSSSKGGTSYCDARIEDLEKRIEELEKRINMSGNQTPPVWAHKALEAAMAVGAIKTSNDKSQAELLCIQILNNLGLFDRSVKNGLI
ncbi:hypothetical protein CJP46_27460 [Paenibacillus sp. XY044]|nr:hypothetical protein CJP46_27460 [Paenibacillus sp. XY044]